MPRGGADGRARAPRRSLHFPRAWRARRARPGSGGRGAARQMTCRPPVAEVGSEPGGDRANVRRRARGDAAAQGAPEPSVEFVTGSSDFYSELRAYYAEEGKEWPARLEG